MASGFFLKYWKLELIETNIKARIPVIEGKAIHSLKYYGGIIVNSAWASSK